MIVCMLHSMQLDSKHIYIECRSIVNRYAKLLKKIRKIHEKSISHLKFPTINNNFISLPRSVNSVIETVATTI